MGVFVRNTLCYLIVHFLKTYIGYSQCTMMLHAIYVFFLFWFLCQKNYLDDPINGFEAFLWTVCIPVANLRHLNYYSLVLVDLSGILGILSTNWWKSEIRD